jgi:hypothetical protein
MLVRLRIRQHIRLLSCARRSQSVSRISVMNTPPRTPREADYDMYSPTKKVQPTPYASPPKQEAKDSTACKKLEFSGDRMVDVMIGYDSCLCRVI